MAYDTALAARMRALLPTGSPVREKAMFGGLVFLVGGRMCAGVVGKRVVLWLGRDGAATALAESRRRTDGLHRPGHAQLHLPRPGRRARHAELQEWLRCAVIAVSAPGPQPRP